jgi:endogenous inhibitor of DNA gyrase (YacG/DUF329 family)
MKVFCPKLKRKIEKAEFCPFCSEYNERFRGCRLKNPWL